LSPSPSKERGRKRKRGFAPLKHPARLGYLLQGREAKV